MKELDRMLAYIESKNPDAMIEYFEKHSSTIIFCPVHLDALEILDTETEITNIDNRHRVATIKIRFKNKRGDIYTSETICIETSNGIACMPRPRGVEK